MGKFIDRAARLTLLAAALYILLVKVFGHPLPACILSFLICAWAVKSRTKRTNARMTFSEARALLRLWAYDSDDAARKNIARLLDAEESRITYLPRHPSSALGLGEVFSAWKARKGQDSFILAAPCRADGRAKAFASTLSSPTVTIADSAVLISRIRRSHFSPPAEPRFRERMIRFRATLFSIPGRRPWYRNLQLGLILMALYLFLGNSMYLLLSILSLFCAGVAARLSFS